MLRRRWPYLLPPLVFILLVVLQPAERFVLPQNPPVPGYPLHGGFTRWITDDCDTLAYALRAENAARGRKAGLVGPVHFDTGTPTSDVGIAPYEPPLVFDPVEYDRKLLVPAEFTDRYFLEYPPAALALFRLGMIGSDRSDVVDISPTLLDSHQVNVAWHAPATDDERTLYRAFRHAVRVYWFVMLLALVGLMVLVERGVGVGGEASGPAWLLVLPGILYFTPCRFDILPAGLVLCSIAAAARHRVSLSGACLGLAVALKMYPLALAPILLRYSSRTWVQAAIWCMAAAAPILLSYGVMAFADGIDGVTIPLKFQLDRGVEPDWCFYGRFLPIEWSLPGSANTVVRAMPVLLAVLVMCIRRPSHVFSLLRRCTIALLMFISFQKFYSPQWWLWIAVLLIPMVRQHRWLFAFVIVHDLFTYLHFPILFDSLYSVEMGSWDNWAATKFGAGVTVSGLLCDTHVWLRAMFWAGLMAAFAWREVISPESAPPVASP